jgi:hypothetical protein
VKELSEDGSPADGWLPKVLADGQPVLAQADGPHAAGASDGAGVE